jgi:hypothetical protein
MWRINWISDPDALTHFAGAIAVSETVEIVSACEQAGYCHEAHLALLLNPVAA